MNSYEKYLIPEQSPGFDVTITIKQEVLSYIYGYGFNHINLEKNELDFEFIYNVVEYEQIKFLSNYYLTLIEKENNAEFNRLKKPEGFSLNEVMKSLCTSLKDNYSKYGIVFQVFKEKLKMQYQENNPISDLLNTPYFKCFCDNLKLNYSTRVCLVLAIINSIVSWIFPSNKDNEYKTNLFMDFVDKDVTDPYAYARKINHHLIQLGLFKSPWTASNYVTSLFLGGINSFSIARVNPVLDEDYYSITSLKILNSEEITVSSKLIRNSCKKQSGNWQLYSGTEYHRIKNLIAFVGSVERFRIYEFKTELLGFNKKELEFYIYALSTKLQDTKAAILLPENISQILLAKETEENSIINLIQEHENRTVDSAESILSYIKVPVILTTQEKPENTAVISENGINIAFSVNIKLPEENEYSENFCNYLCKQKVPANVVSTATDICSKMMVSSSKWHEIAELLKNTTYFSKEEIKLLLEKKYFSENTNSKIKKDSHYCLEALNISEPINQFLNELITADTYQKQEYDEKSGVRILQTGISGGGKTSLVEETARILQKKLQIIRASDILSSLVGETEKNIKRIFATAAKDKAILLIDEADSFLQPRGDHLNHHNDIMVNEFLVQMERYPGILFCNTNLPDNLDKALDRRFHFKINYKPLTKNGISLLCKSYFEQYNISESQINEIYSSGDVCPGDFGALNGKIRFVEKGKINSDYITSELCKIVNDKKRSWENKKIGFGN